MTQAEQILSTLGSQAFENWYRETFDNYVVCEENAPSKETILQNIRDLFRLPEKK